MYWPILTTDLIQKTVTNALKRNIDYRKKPVLGVPASFLDPEIFYDDAPFLHNAPFLSALIANPNHIGCHTLGHSESFFAGTQEIERQVIGICAEQIFKGEKDQQDGYIASGGTEANIQAVWIYRNFYRAEKHAALSEIGLIYSEDSHYSLAKSANILSIRALPVHVDENTREMDLEHFSAVLENAQKKGIRYFIINLNMLTTMFGSVDPLEKVCSILTEKNIDFKLHVDAAFGGFIYPFSNPNNPLNFKHAHIDSITIDAHKMLLTPYGTGIFLIRKGYMSYVKTNEAQYVAGTDHTLCGSRSGANAVAVWMVLHTYGSDGWKLKVRSLIERCDELCARLDTAGVEYYRNAFANIVAIKASSISPAIAEKYGLVADTHDGNPNWWKIVMMPHITRGTVDLFMNDVSK